MWNSYILTKRRGLVFLLLIVVVLLIGKYTNDTGDSNVLIFAVTAIGIGWLVQNIRRRIRRQDDKKKFENLVQQYGWTFDGATDALTIQPKHLRPNTWSQRNLQGTSLVYTKILAEQPAWAIYEEWWKIEDDSHKMPILRIRPSEILDSQMSVVFSLPGYIDGWARIAPAPNRIFSYPGDLELESNQFNINIYFHADPPRLAPAIMSPTMMEWYAGLPEKPWIHIEQQRGVFSFERPVSYEDFQALVAFVPEFIRLLKSSGALDPVRSGGNTDHTSVAD